MNYSLPSESPDVGEIEVRIPLLAEEGGRASLIEAGAPGAKREPDRAKPQLMVSSAKLFRPEDFAEMTTITASRYRARASRPSAALTVASQLLVDAAATPPLRGGEYSTFNISSIHSHLLWRPDFISCKKTGPRPRLL